MSLGDPFFPWMDSVTATKKPHSRHKPEREPTSRELVQAVINAAEELGRLKKEACRRLGVTGNDDLNFLVDFHVGHGECPAPPQFPDKEVVTRERNARDRLTRAIGRGPRKRR